MWWWTASFLSQPTTRLLTTLCSSNYTKLLSRAVPDCSYYNHQKQEVLILAAVIVRTGHTICQVVLGALTTPIVFIFKSSSSLTIQKNFPKEEFMAFSNSNFSFWIYRWVSFENKKIPPRSTHATQSCHSSDSISVCHGYLSFKCPKSLIPLCIPGPFWW